MLQRLGRLSPTVQRLLLLAGCALFYTVWPVRVPLTEIDEGRYAEAVREMVTSRDYLIPHFDYVQRYQKPILYYWLQAPFVKLFGVHEWAARLPSAVLAILLVLMLHAFLLHWLARRDEEEKRTRGRGAAFLGAVAVATMPFIAVWARAATTDLAITFFTTAMLLALLQADLERRAAPDTRRGNVLAQRWYLLAAVAGGLAFLTKGPVGLIVPGLTWIAYHLLNREFRKELLRIPWYTWLSCLAIIVVVAAPWYVATYYVDGPEFLTRFFLTENLERFTSSSMEGHGAGHLFGPLFGHLFGLFPLWPEAVFLAFPFSAMALREIAHPFSGVTLPADSLMPRIRRFALAWIVADIGLFSLSSTQLPNYIQAIAGGVAILFAINIFTRYAPTVPEGPHPREPQMGRQARVGRTLEKGALIVGGIVFALLPTYGLLIDKAHGARMGMMPVSEPLVIGLSLLSVLAGAFFLIGTFRKSKGVVPTPSITWTTFAWLPLFIIFATAAFLWIRAYYGAVVEVGDIVRSQSPPVRRVLACTPKMAESLVYACGCEVEFFQSPEGKRVYGYAALWTKGDATFSEELAQAHQRHERVVVITDGAGLAQTSQYAKTFLWHSQDDRPEQRDLTAVLIE